MPEIYIIHKVKKSFQTLLLHAIDEINSKKVHRSAKASCVHLSIHACAEKLSDKQSNRILTNVFQQSITVGYDVPTFSSISKVMDNYKFARKFKRNSLSSPRLK